MEPIINAHAPEFTVQAFQNGEFRTVSSKDIEGKWLFSSSIQLTSPSFVPTELEDLARQIRAVKGHGCRGFLS